MADRKPASSSNRPLGRRGFFRELARKAILTFEEVRGRPQLSLAQLDELPDERLREVIPLVTEGWEIIVEEEQVLASHVENGKRVVLFSRDTASTQAFNLFDGSTTLGQASRQLAELMNWEEAKSFAYVRDLFLNLARLRVCQPVNPVA